jgi:hypothetical protein
MPRLLASAINSIAQQAIFTKARFYFIEIHKGSKWLPFFLIINEKGFHAITDGLDDPNNIRAGFPPNLKTQAKTKNPHASLHKRQAANISLNHRQRQDAKRWQHIPGRGYHEPAVYGLPLAELEL